MIKKIIKIIYIQNSSSKKEKNANINKLNSDNSKKIIKTIYCHEDEIISKSFSDSKSQIKIVKNLRNNQKML